MVGVVFHHVITFEDPHEYKAAVMLTCGSSGVACCVKNERIEGPFISQQSISNDASDDCVANQDSNDE